MCVCVCVCASVRARACVRQRLCACVRAPDDGDDDVENYGVHDRLQIYPQCGIVYFPWHRHQIKATNSF